MSCYCFAVGGYQDIQRNNRYGFSRLCYAERGGVWLEQLYRIIYKS